MTSPYEHVRLDVADGVATLTLHRPDRLNSFTVDMHREMRDALERIAADRALRCLVLTGAGRGFCAGQDLADRAVVPGSEALDLGASIENHYKPMLMKLRALRMGIGRDRPSYAPGFDADSAVNGDPAQWFNPQAFVLQPAGTFGTTCRGDFTGPDLRTVDLAFSKDSRLGSSGRALELRIEVFNLFNRANFGIPNLTAFAGAADNEPVLGSFGRIRNTVTSARQMQLGVRLRF